MDKYIKLLRIKHYIKNFLIFVPLFFSGFILYPELLFKNIIGFINFSLAASVVYVVNDMKDMERDRQHPTKCKRPLASGSISIKRAYIILVLLSIALMVLSIAINGKNIVSWMCLITYIIINLLYSMGLKNIALIDVFILALGYVLRVYYGGSITDVDVSVWLYFTVISFAFYLGMGKRRNEMDGGGEQTRKVLLQYNRNFLDKNMYLCLALTIIFYSLWCENITTEKMKGGMILFSVPLVILICMRYSLIIEGDSDGDPIEVIFNDKAIITLIALFLIFMVIIVYFRA